MMHPKVIHELISAEELLPYLCFSLPRLASMHYSVTRPAVALNHRKGDSEKVIHDAHPKVIHELISAEGLLPSLFFLSRLASMHYSVARPAGALNTEKWIQKR